MKKPENLRLIVLVSILVVVGIWFGVSKIRQAGSKDGVVRVDDLVWQPHELPELGSIEVGSGGNGPDRIDRNPFLYGPPPTPTPDLRPTATPRPVPTRRPPPPRPTATPTPPGWRPPPPFTMDYLGHFGPAGRRVAVFRKKQGDDSEIAVALEGGTLEKKFIVREIDLESVVIGYVGFPEKEIKRVPLAQN